MPKTKEEVTKILEKNYNTVQVTELNVYDKTVELDKTFSKDIKTLSTALKADQKTFAQEEVDIETEYAKKQAELLKIDAALQADVAAKEAEANKVYDVAMNDALVKYEAVAEVINLEVEAINKANAETVADVLKTYEEEVKQSEKTIVTINEKDVKDQNTFATKIEELKTKYELKIEELKDKESTKISKLTEASNKQVEKLEENMLLEREKLDKNLATMKPLYEEELAEIDENIENDRIEYEEKHESIRSSADQRIAVREKHLHRAMDENNQRSVKEHKRDIEKFRKEADKDLVQLRKNYNVKKSQSAEYRVTFIKENFEKLANLERTFLKAKEDRQHEIDSVEATLVNDIKNTKLEYEKLQADELDKFNKQYTDVRKKQEDVLREKEINLVKEEQTQNNFKFHFDKENDVNEELLYEKLEEQAKLLRDANIEKIKDELLAKDILDNELRKLENVKDIQVVELAKDQKATSESEKIENYKVQQKKRTAVKDEFYSYQTKLEPLYNARANELFKYEELEINNRFALKADFLSKEKILVDKDYEVVVQKIEEVFAFEKAPFEEIITELAGSKQEELLELEEEHNEKVEQLKEKISSLDPRRQKKEVRQYNDNLEDLERDFKRVKSAKEQEIKNATGVYQTALDACVSRYEQALLEAKELNDKENARLAKATELLESNKAVELEDAKSRQSETERSVNDFLTGAANRNQNSTESSQTFLDARVEASNNAIALANQLFTETREALNDQFNRDVQSLADQKQSGLDDYASSLSDEERNLEDFKVATLQKIKSFEQKELSDKEDQEKRTTRKIESIDQKFDAKLEDISDELKRQEDDYDNHLKDIDKKYSTEKQHFESELKRVKREAELRVKDGLIDINRQLSTDIAGIK